MISSVEHASRPSVRVDTGTMSPLRPFAWLRLALRDLVACWPANAAHGLLMVLLGWVLLLLLGNHPYFVSAAVSGFLLFAPVMATGICELSRRLSQRQRLGFNESLDAIGREGRALFRFGIVLGGIAILWFALSELLLAPAFSVSMPSVAETYYLGFLAGIDRVLAAWFVATGAVLAAIVFLLSVVTVPLVIDRGVPAGAAMRASMRVAYANPLTMIVWATLIVCITAVGFATLLIGMIVLIPLLGHATWHAYRDLVR